MTTVTVLMNDNNMSFLYFHAHIYRQRFIKELGDIHRWTHSSNFHDQDKDLKSQWDPESTFKFLNAYGPESMGNNIFLRLWL